MWFAGWPEAGVARSWAFGSMVTMTWNVPPGPAGSIGAAGSARVRAVSAGRGGVLGEMRGIVMCVLAGVLVSLPAGRDEHAGEQAAMDPSGAAASTSRLAAMRGAVIMSCGRWGTGVSVRSV